MDNVDWTGFLDRKGLSKSEAARLLGAAPAMMTEWIKGKANPTYKYLKKLCEIGMTAQEMFGEESGAKLLSNSECAVPPPEIMNDPKFRKGIDEQILSVLRDKGLIK